MRQESFFNQILEVVANEGGRDGIIDVSQSTMEALARPSTREPAPSPPTSAPAAPMAREARGDFQAAPAPSGDESAAIPPNALQTEPVAATTMESMDFSALRNLAQRCGMCPLHRGRTTVVFGDGNENADLMFIGEGPGADEDRTGVPFVGKAGKLLDKMIAAMQFRREDVYIANIVKCRPPRNRNPEASEAERCLPYLRRQIQLINPKVIVLLGAVPLLFLLKKTGITRLHGQWFEFMGVRTIPTFHPAYLLRYNDAKKLAWSDLRKVMDVFGKTPAPKTKR